MKKRPCCAKCAAEKLDGLRAVHLAAAAGASLAGIESDLLPDRSSLNAADQELGRFIRSTGAEIFDGMAGLPGSEDLDRFLAAWNRYVSDYNAWTGVWWWNVLSRRDELLSFRRSFNDLLASWEALSKVAPVQKPFEKSEVSGDDAAGPPSAWHSTIKWVAGAGIVIGGAYMLAPAIGLFNTAKRKTR
jgi:hypothetical protein